MINDELQDSYHAWLGGCLEMAEDSVILDNLRSILQTLKLR